MSNKSEALQKIRNVEQTFLLSQNETIKPFGKSRVRTNALQIMTKD